jgi:hypothetical protein
MVFRPLCAITVIAAIALTPAQASADNTACAAASESGQRLRQAEKLKAARDQFAICAEDACPRLIKADCIQWLGEVSSVIPTMTVGVLDENGRDLIDVKVSVDGVTVMQRLDGKGLSVDPGVHTVRVEPVGKDAKEERVVISVGDKARKVSFTYAATSTGDHNTGGGGAGAGAPGRREHTAGPWVIVGVGVASIGVGLGLALSVSDKDKEVPASCINASCAPEDTNAANKAVSAKNRQTAGFITLGAGIAVVGGGLIWHFLEPTDGPEKAAAQRKFRVRPDLGFNYAGLSGSF